MRSWQGGEYGHGVPPLIVATLSIVVGWIAWRKRLPSSALTVATGGRGNVRARAFTGENLNIRVFTGVVPSIELLVQLLSTSK
jgi:hypothetical protein